MGKELKENMTKTSVSKISSEEYDKQAELYTAQQLTKLNEQVRQNPQIAEKSTFFRNDKNQKGLPIFTGKHTRFEETPDEGLIAVDATSNPLPGPQIRTAQEISEDNDENVFYPNEDEDDEDEENESEDEDLTENFASLTTEDQIMTEEVLPQNTHIRFEENEGEGRQEIEEMEIKP